MANDDLVLFERDERNSGVAVITLNRPEKGNSLNAQLIAALCDLLDKVDNDHSIRAVILKSAGPHGSYGADLNDLVKKTEDGNYKNIRYKEAYAHLVNGRTAVRKIFKLRVPIVGIMHGYTLGGGAEIYMMCDKLYGASGDLSEGGLRFGFPEATIGIMSGWMGPEVMVRKIGPITSLDIFCSGRILEPEECVSMGIIRKALPKDELYDYAFKWADMITRNAPFAVESTRRTIKNAAFPDFDRWIETTAKEAIDNLLTEDFVRGAKRILEHDKTPPKYKRI